MASSINFQSPPIQSSTASSAFDNKNLSSFSNDNRYNNNNNSTLWEHDSNRQVVDQIIWNAGLFGQGQYYRQQTVSRSSSDRNLLHFLQNNMDPNDIKERKLNRINASAAALVARRAFQFAAIDGTGLGWSSASLAICLSRLTALYDEHKSQLNTLSFYPFRLVLSSDEFMRQVDLYGGVIRLNPAATPLQWLGTLATVTTESIRALKQNRQRLKDNLAIVENALDIKVVKGYSCEPEDYHRCIEMLAMESTSDTSKEQDKTSLTMALNNASLVIESDQACRRGKLRKDGTFEVGAGMSMSAIRSTLNSFTIRAREYTQIETHHMEECRKMEERVIYELGLQKVSKASKLLTYEQMSQCLVSLISKDEEDKDVLRTFLAGQAIGISGRGQPCHLGDDGSIVIPWNVS